MKSFLKYTLATITGILISGFLITILFFGIMGAMISSTEKTVTIKPNSILYLKINRPIPDRTPQNPFSGINFLSSEFQSVIGLNDLLSDIHKAKDDPKIKGVYLDFGLVNPGIATLEELRDALADFKTSGKFILAYSNELLPQTSYYLATIADKIYLNPVAIFQFVGLRSEVMFYKGALDKLGIDMQIIRHGKFKSAVEPYFRKDMSSENRNQILTYMGSIWNQMLDEISISRSISKEELNLIADQLKINDPEDAVQTGLIDGIKYQDEIEKELKKLSGVEENKKLNLVTPSKYSKVPVSHRRKGFTRNKIAVVYASGIIGLGSGSDNNIGGIRFMKSIRKVREDSTIKAIVLRVNSPGGSALASELIWREVSLASQAKPVIGSMGNLAASGGYYILAPADTLMCHPMTLTGSIGVFATIPNAKKLMNEKLGLTIDVAKTNQFSDFGSLYRPLNPTERTFFQVGIEKTYGTFISHVSEGRGLSVTEVDKIGQGRVWSGINAKDIGLVDEFGGLTQAIKMAANKANITNYRIVNYPKFEDPYQKLLKILSADMQSRKLRKNWGTLYNYFVTIKDMLKDKGIQMQLPFYYEIH